MENPNGSLKWKNGLSPTWGQNQFILRPFGPCKLQKSKSGHSVKLNYEPEGRGSNPSGRAIPNLPHSAFTPQLRF